MHKGGFQQNAIFSVTLLSYATEADMPIKESRQLLYEIKARDAWSVCGCTMQRSVSEFAYQYARSAGRIEVLRVNG